MSIDLDAALANFEAELGVDFSADDDSASSTVSVPSTARPAAVEPPPRPSYIISEPARLAQPEALPVSSSYGPVRTAHGSATATPYSRPAYQAFVGLDPQASAIGAAAVAAASAASGVSKEASAETGEQKHLRKAAGKIWSDATLDEWPENDVRLFIGNLGDEVGDQMLAAFFSAYPSFAKAKVVREKRTGNSKGYGFASFLDPNDAVKAFRDKHGKYLGSRPCSITRSTWKDRDFESASKHGGGGGGKKFKR
jgi:hypothetical protein